MAKEKKDKIKKEKTGEEICETFEIENDGKKEVKTVCDIIPEKKASENQIKKENEILKNLIIVLGFILIIFIAGYFFVNSVRHFEYEGVDFNVIKEGNLIFYNTIFPMYSDGKHTADYNFYLRNDPRKLDNIGFDGNLKLSKNAVINMTEEFNCDGDGMISIANLLKPLNVLGVDVIQDKNATCDPQGRYMFIQIQPSDSNVSKITQTGELCYNIEINECEILKTTERFMLELFIRFNEVVNK